MGNLSDLSAPAAASAPAAPAAANTPAAPAAANAPTAPAAASAPAADAQPPSDASASEEAQIAIADDATAQERDVIMYAATVGLNVNETDIRQAPVLRVTLVHAPNKCVYIVVCKVCSCKAPALHYDFGAKNVATIREWTPRLRRQWMANFAEEGAVVEPAGLMKM